MVEDPALLNAVMVELYAMLSGNTEDDEEGEAAEAAACALARMCLGHRREGVNACCPEGSAALIDLILHRLPAA